MPEDLKQPKVISKKNTGFPEYLDFDTLRKEGIGYLGKLSGKLWTDHNVHDPGITILEMLCYALLDLGYRTNLPAADIFTKNPNGPSQESNFFTPAQILTNNPLTITDFRKLLIDIPGIKNAWLEIAKDYDAAKFCNSNNNPSLFIFNNAIADDVCCDKYLNGLYHVYIESEIDIEKVYASDSTKKDEFTRELQKKVADALLAHRNFCEDFMDITILCKLELGLCADIELEAGADTEQVYLQIAEILYHFFSPAPSFYTLSQLLDKGKTMDEIFAGRPMDITESHGFVDTAEFEQLVLKKEIHLSDVYNVLLGVKGVRRVQRLKLVKCGEPPMAEKWKFKVPKDHVIEFSIACSGFQFSRHGVPVIFNAKEFDRQVEINSYQNGKIWYTKMFPALDSEIPQGVYRKDIDEYYSIQNEFPRVYGIAEGGLPDDAAKKSKAKAYQLKAYLLFFDQMLASYLSQLKNIQSLFSLSSSGNDDSNHTYFVNNNLDTVPDLKKLLRLAAGENISGVATQGSTLARPVDKKILTALIDSGQITTINIETVSNYKFKTTEAADIAVAQLGNDIYNNVFDYGIVQKNEGCVFYYLLSSSDCMALLSNIYFSNETDAKLAVESLTYVATFNENYSAWYDTLNNYASFNIQFTLADYSKYLQMITEDKALYQQRRQSFLNHLLSRFSEQFTDFALLSYSSYLNDTDGGEIKAKENFLSAYPALSSNRGKAYNYKLNGWNNDNISGFEKRFKAYSGIQNWKRHSLCNFEVIEYQNKYGFNLSFLNKTLFVTAEIFDSKEDARDALHILLQQLKHSTAYSVGYNSNEHKHTVELDYSQKQCAEFSTKFQTKEEAEKIKEKLQQFFSGTFKEEDIFISSYLYNARLVDHKGEIVKSFHESPGSAAAAKSAAIKNIAKINTVQLWKDTGEEKKITGKLIFDAAKDDSFLIDTGNFKIISNNAIVGSPDKYTYQLLDRKNTFKLECVNEFTDEKSARDNSEQLLLLMMEDKNYSIEKNKDSGKYNILVKHDQHVSAISDISFGSEQAAKTALASIKEIVDKSCYRMVIHQFPDTWKFNYKLGFNTGEQFLFESSSTFKTMTDAKKAGTAFSISAAAMDVKETAGLVTLSSSKNKKNSITVILTKADLTEKKKQVDAITSLLAVRKEAMMLGQSNAEELDRFIEIDAVSRTGLFVYRLVDKDNLYAFYKRDAAQKEILEKLLPSVISFDKNQYNYLDLCLKGDLVDKRKDDKNNSYWYHYQVKSATGIINPAATNSKVLVLFESTKGYESSEAAVKAFEKNYFDILRLASVMNNYGPGKPVSTTELFIQNNDACVNGESIVFVPKETLDYLGDTTTAIPELIKVVKSYPVKKIFPKADCKEFHTRFQSCEEGKCIIEEKVDCSNMAKEKPVYYFSLYNKQEDREDWQAVRYYETPAETWQEFQFFILLLRYHGNYFIDCSCNSVWNEGTNFFDSSSVYKIFIREVLTESAGRFMTEAAAWGPGGIQKFIDVSQSENAFHTYLEKEHCCNSFYVACANTKLYHPCKYNTPERRDDVMRLLYISLEKIKKWNWEGYCNKVFEPKIIRDFEGKEIATVSTDMPLAAADYFEWYAGMLNRVALYGLCIENNQLYLRGKSISFQAVDPAIKVEILKDKLLWLASYFPFTIKTGADNKTKYCIEIKIPGFDSDGIDDCGSDDEDKEICYTAWSSDCCYSNCNGATDAYTTALQLLSDFRNYRPVYDCECHSYGIALHYINSLDTAGANKECGYFENQIRTVLPCDNAIVARNPQCYPDVKIACDAVQRTKALINAEGLHAAEHILMRPHCIEECNCSLPAGVNHFPNCKFPYWEKPSEDPCQKEKAVCFIPGYDPYSFIATVVLPAWPVRFRNKENRLQLENILYRETPAHVLLRILWLAPHDFCCFEKTYKKWLAWLGQKKQCTDFTFCDLKEFLFYRQYELPANPQSCIPCDETVAQPNPCQTDRIAQKTKDDAEKWTAAINEIFTWESQDQGTYQFKNCEVEKISPHHTNIPGIEMTARLGKAKFVRNRFAQYSKNIDELVKETKGIKIVVLARRFMDSNTPTAEAYKALAEAIVKAQADTKNKVLNKKRAAILISTVTRFFIDKWAFNGKKISSLQQSADTFELLRKNKTDMFDIYRLWESDALKKHEPGIDMNAVKYLLTDNK